MILQIALRGLSHRWQAIPPDVRRTHWPATVLCLATGGAWGYIILRIDEVMFWDRDSIHVLDTWARAWTLGVVFDTIATAIIVALGLEVAQRFVRILAWNKRKRAEQDGEPGPDGPVRNGIRIGLLAPRYGGLTFLAVLAAIVCGTSAALVVLTEVLKYYTWRELVVEAVLLFAGTFICIFAMVDWVHHVIRLAQGPGMHITPGPPRPPLRGPVDTGFRGSDDATGR